MEIDEGTLRAELPTAPEGALDALGRAAGSWGGRFSREGSGGTLRIPVTAGLRSGHARLRASVSRHAAGSEVTLYEEEISYELRWASVGLLCVGALGALAGVLWPFGEAFRAVAPTGIALAVVCWLLILSRLHNSGPREFLEHLEAVAGEPPE